MAEAVTIQTIEQDVVAVVEAGRVYIGAATAIVQARLDIIQAQKALKAAQEILVADQKKGQEAATLLQAAEKKLNDDLAEFERLQSVVGLDVEFKPPHSH